MHDKIYRLVVLMLFGSLLAACSGSASPVKPASDRPTLLYFYTEN